MKHGDLKNVGNQTWKRRSSALKLCRIGGRCERSAETSFCGLATFPVSFAGSKENLSESTKTNSHRRDRLHASVQQLLPFLISGLAFVLFFLFWSVHPTSPLHRLPLPSSRVRIFLHLIRYCRTNWNKRRKGWTSPTVYDNEEQVKLNTSGQLKIMHASLAGSQWFRSLKCASLRKLCSHFYWTHFDVNVTQHRMVIPQPPFHLEKPVMSCISFVRSNG